MCRVMTEVLLPQIYGGVRFFGWDGKRGLGPFVSLLFHGALRIVYVILLPTTRNDHILKQLSPLTSNRKEISRSTWRCSLWSSIDLFPERLITSEKRTTQLFSFLQWWNAFRFLFLPLTKKIKFLHGYPKYLI